jgi:hypothetical protein
MKQVIAAIGLVLAMVGSANAEQAIAERVVTYKTTVLTLQLSDGPVDSIDCKFGQHSARMLSAVAGYPASTQRINLGCWLVNRDGSVEYSGVDQNTGKDIYILLSVDDFKKLPGFTTWSDYMSQFLLTGGQ